MLFVFNSGYRKGYSTNIQRTLGLPLGCVNKYVYRTPTHVTQGTLDRIGERAGNEPVCVVFIDRDAPGGYRYYLVRMGILAGPAAIEGGSAHISAALGPVPETVDFDAFSNWVRDTLVPLGAPQRNLAQPDQDGQYVIFGPDLPGGLLDAAADGWPQLVRRLATASAFKVDGAPALFTRVRISPEDQPHTQIAAEGAGLMRKVPVQRGETYALTVSYFFPLQEIDYGATATCTAGLGDELQAKSILTGTIDTIARDFTSKFQVRRFTETTESHIALTAQPPGGFAAILASPVDFRLELGEPVSMKRWIIGLGIAYAIGVGTLTALSLTSPAPWQVVVAYAATGLQYAFAVLALRKLGLSIG